MNIVKIKALYPPFLNMLRQFDPSSGHSDIASVMVNQMRTLELAESVSTNRYNITLRDTANPGQHADWLAWITGTTFYEFVPARVFDWIRQQLPTLSEECSGRASTGWSIYLQASDRRPVPEAQTLHLWAHSSDGEISTLLRGLRAYQAKRRKRACRLINQLWTYHLQQQALKAAPRIAIPTSEKCAMCVAKPATNGLLPQMGGRLLTRVVDFKSAVIMMEGSQAA